MMLDSILDDIQELLIGDMRFENMEARLDSRIAAFESETVEGVRSAIIESIANKHLDGEA
jgi:hypothetical protein